MENKLSKLLEDNIYPNIDILEAFSELEPRKGSKNYSCYCPSCGKKRAFISINKKNSSPQISCNRKDTCGYYESLWGYIENKGVLSKYETLKELARLANYNLEDNNTTTYYSNTVVWPKTVKSVQNVEYKKFDEKKEYTKVSISKFIPRYKHGSKRQKLILIYTYIYQYSLQTDLTKRDKYYESRGIKTNNRYINQIGYLTSSDVKKLENDLMGLFPIEDLENFGVMKVKTKQGDEVKDRYGNNVYIFKQYCFKGFCVIPSFDLYSSVVTGLKFRNVALADWQSKNMKEPEMSNRDIVYPLPFGINRDMLLDKSSCVFMTEGHVDALSIPITSARDGQQTIDFEKANTYFIASPGVNGMSDEILGLLKGKLVCLCFDQDAPGRKAAYGSINILYGDEKASFVNDIQGRKDAQALISSLEKNCIQFNMYKLKGMAEKLRQAGVRVLIKHWDIALGGDCNELLQNNNLNKVFSF